MLVYNPHNEQILRERISLGEEILQSIHVKNCFITGSFLYKAGYKDIDVFIISRAKKKITASNNKVKITFIDFNDLYSLFYHSVSKSCMAKNILPTKPLKVTISDYWSVINEAVPTLLNQKDKYHKDVRFLILYTEYFKTGEILDTFQLNERIRHFKNYKEVLEFVNKDVPEIIRNNIKQSYVRRFFYTQAGVYKGLREYAAQSFLYALTHAVVKNLAYGQS